MSERTSHFSRHWFWMLNFLLWTLIAFLQAVQNYTSTISEGLQADLLQSFLLQIATYYPWALLSPLLYTFFQRYPLERLISVKTLVMLPALAIACVALQIASHTTGMIVFPSPTSHPRGFWEIYPVMLRWISFPGFLTFAAIVGVCHAINYYHRMREREELTERLEKELTEARLNALQTQLQPHFFFNTLHSIASLVRDQQSEAAVKMIAKLSDLFRYTLDQVATQKIALEQELDFLRGYLEIEQTRFSDRLTVKWDIQSEANNALVPFLFLQPIVENAVKHGISTISSPGTIDIHVRIDGAHLRATVTNDGNGLDPAWEQKTNTVGIRNVRRRLGELYGAKGMLTIQTTESDKVVTAIEFPYERSA